MYATKAIASMKNTKSFSNDRQELRKEREQAKRELRKARKGKRQAIEVWGNC